MEYLILENIELMEQKNKYLKHGYKYSLNSKQELEILVVKNVIAEVKN